jgi:predicted MFS family arabinose efflux permease
MSPAPAPLRRRGFRRLAVAQTVSSVGDWLATFALMSLVLEISGSAAAVGGVLALRLAPATVAGPLIGFAASRWDRRTILVSLDVVRAVIALLVPLVATLWWVYPWTIALEVAAVVAISARDASIRDLVDEHDLPAANGMLLGATYGAIPLGAGAFAGVVAVAGSLPGALGDLGARPAFWLDAATFLFSAALIRRITEIGERTHGWDEEGGVPSIHLRDAWRNPLVRTTLAPILAASLGIGSLFSLGVGFVRDTLGASEAQFGTLVVVFGFGAAAGLAFRQLGPVSGIRAVRLGVLVMGGVMIAMAFAGGLVVTLVMALGFGAGGAFAIVSGLTVLQEDERAETRMVALGAFHVTVRVALALGALAAGLAADLLTRDVLGLAPIRVVLLVAGVLVSASATVVRETEGTGAGVGEG